MIVPGQATVVGSDVTITSPGQFNVFQSVRLTNYTNMVLILTNIDGTSQSQEYLLPLQQMVYPFRNIQKVPTITTLSVGGGINTPPTVLVEWSTDPVSDFLGTYPTTIGAPSGVPYFYVSYLITNFSASVPLYTVIGANPFREQIQLINHYSGDIRWSTERITSSSDWTTKPPITSGTSRTLVSTGAIYLEPVASDTTQVIEVIEQSWDIASVVDQFGIL